MYFLLVASLETAMNNIVVSNEQWKVEPQFIYIHKKKTSWCIAVYFNYCLI